MPVMPSSLVADGVLLLALLIHAELLGRLRRVDSDNPPWWFGYARDGSNLSAFSMLLGAFLLLHFALPIAMLAAGLSTIATYVLDWLIGRALKLPRAQLLLALPLTAWVAIVAFFPSQLGWLFTRLIDAVQPRH
jgi:hypothetical protein